MKVKNLMLFSLLFFCAIPVSSQRVEAATVRQQFKASVAELQKNPDNQALRKKIIKMARKLKPRPAVPEEAERYMARGSAAVEFAKDAKGYRKAVVEFEKAALAAPWLAEVYYNLGIVQNKTGDYAAAMKNLKLYLLAAPGARNAKKVKSLIYKIEFKLEQKNYAASTEGKKAEMNKFLDSLDGGKWKETPVDTDYSFDWFLEVRGDKLVQLMVGARTICRWCGGVNDLTLGSIHEPGTSWTISGRKFRSGKHSFEFSEDGETITKVSIGPKGGAWTSVWKRVH